MLLAVSAPAGADWLVTRSGTAIETAGAWELRGPLVVFTSTAGQLSSLRAREVDLDASRARTAAPPEPEPEPVAAPAPLRRGPVLVITDADVGHVDRQLAAAEETPGDEEAAIPSAEEPAASVVEILSWGDRIDVQANTLEVFGTAANRGSSLATDTRVEVRLLDSDGELLQSRQASLAAGAMGPGALVSFSATFPGSPGFAAIEFDVKSRGFKLRAEPEADADQ